MVRKAFAFILSISLCGVNPAQAEAIAPLNRPATAVDTHAFFQRFERALTRTSLRAHAEVAKAFSKDEMIRKIQTAPRAMTEKMISSHVSQTLTMLWIISLVEAVRERQRLKPISDIQVPLTDLIATTADKMVNSFDLWSGYLGGSSAGATFKVVDVAKNQALKQLGALAASKATQTFLSRLLSMGAGSFGAFVSWEAGRRLISKATFLMDAKDAEVAKNLRFTTMIFGGGTTDEQRVFRQLMSLSFDILAWEDPALTRSWIYDTWRLNIGTGEFFVVLGGMVAAGTAAGTIFPGAGNVVGFLFGLAGGLGATLLPHEYKQPITDGIRLARINMASGSLHENLKQIRMSAPANRAKLLSDRRSYREDMITAYIEQIYDAQVRLQDAEFILKTIEARRTEKLKGFDQAAAKYGLPPQVDYQSLAATAPDDERALETNSQAIWLEARERILYYANKVLDIQRREVDALAGVLYHHFNGVEPLLQKTLQDQQSVHMSFRHIFLGLRPEMRESLGLESLDAKELEKLIPAASTLLNLFYLNAFNESTLVE